MLDLPAFGKPPSAGAAGRRSSNSRRRCWPGSPRSWKWATRRPADRAALPRPPLPPLAATKRVPAAARSASSRPWSSRTSVPTGTGRTRSPPSAPLRLLPCPCVPLRARWCGWKWYSTRVAMPGSATRRTSPPRPAVTSMVVSSTNTEVRRLLELFDAGQPAAAHLVVDDATVRLGEQRVVAATADALARVDAGAALAHQDRSGGDDLAGVPLHPEALGRGVAAVAAGRSAFLVGHLGSALLLLRWVLGGPPVAAGVDALDPEPGQRLAVALVALLAGLVLVGVDQHLPAPVLTDHGGGDGRLGELGGRRGDLAPVVHHEQGRELEAR